MKVEKIAKTGNKQFYDYSRSNVKNPAKVVMTDESVDFGEIIGNKIRHYNNLPDSELRAMISRRMFNG